MTTGSVVGPLPLTADEAESRFFPDSSVLPGSVVLVGSLPFNVGKAESKSFPDSSVFGPVFLIVDMESRARSESK